MLGNQFKPAILQCFGDIAQAIGGEFELYLSTIAQVLDQAANINIDTNISYEMLDYIVSLREGIMDAWAGAIMAMKAGNKGDFDNQFDANTAYFRVSRSLEAVCAVDFQATSHCFPRPEPQ